MLRGQGWGKHKCCVASVEVFTIELSALFFTMREHLGESPMFPPDTRILVIDDMPSIRDLVKNTLKAMGYSNLKEAADGEEGLKVLMQSNVPGMSIQLVISDWNMPNMKGLELLKHVRSTIEWANLPFVLLTSESERDQVTEAVLAGVSQYIVKPFSAKIFEDKLKAAWQKHNK